MPIPFTVRQTNVPGRDVTVSPSRYAPVSQLQPLDGKGITLMDGFWANRQKINRDVSLRNALRELEEWGGLPYLRAAADRAGIPEVKRFNDLHVYKILDSDVYKWLEAAAYENLRQPLPTDLAQAADEIVDLIVRAQTVEGAVHTWVTVHGVPPLSNWLEGHELYCAGHLIQTAVAWHRSGDDRLLAVAERLADFIAATRRGEPRLLSLHPGLEMALVELYRVTAARRFLDQAMDNLDRRGRDSFGYWRFSPEHFVDDIPVRAATEIRGHAVMSLFLLCGMVDAAVETGDSALLSSAERQWEDMVHSKLYLTGGAGSRQHDEAFGGAFELAPDTAYSETCAAVAGVMLSWRLLLATGEAKYADLIERTVYNGFLSGVSLDGTSYFYVNPLHVREPGRVQSPDGYTHRQPWFECACCPPNAMRLIGTIHHLVATGDPDGVQLHQFIPSQIEAPGRAGGRVITVDTDLPFGDGRLAVTVDVSDGETWLLKVRKPEWAGEIAVTASWAAGPLTVPEDEGYFAISRAWQPGDRIEVRMPVRVRRVVADPRVDSLRGQEALMRGPIVYCLEEPGLPSGTDIESVRLPATLDAHLVPSGLGIPALRIDLEAEERPPSVGLYVDRESISVPGAAPVQAEAVPYFAWGNRGACRMKVWVPATGR